MTLLFLWNDTINGWFNHWLIEIVLSERQFYTGLTYGLVNYDNETQRTYRKFETLYHYVDQSTWRRWWGKTTTTKSCSNLAIILSFNLVLSSFPYSPCTTRAFCGLNAKLQFPRPICPWSDHLHSVMSRFS